MCRFPFRLLLAASLAASSHAALALSPAEVFAKAHHAVYMIIVSGDEPGVVDVIAQGSAVLIAPGRFVTNCHVLDSGKHFIVSRREDKVIERVLPVSNEKENDLCELDLAEMKPGFDKPVQIAPPQSLQIGATVFAIGSPRGMELTISNGIASGFTESKAGTKLIQTTAPLSPGSSGGGLFDDQGRLVGIATMVAKDSQNLNFAVSAQYIPSAHISAAALLKQRTGVVKADRISTQEMAFERQERVRRQEQEATAARQRQLDAGLTILPGKPDAGEPASAQQPAAPRKPIASRLAPIHSLADNRLPLRLYEKMAKTGQLNGLDDNAAIRKVYETLIRQRVAEQLKWNEGGDYVAEFHIQLRRSGEVMFAIPGKTSGMARFDEEAERAIGAASPFPVPQDDEAFAQISNLTIAVESPPIVRANPAAKKKSPK